MKVVLFRGDLTFKGETLLDIELAASQPTWVAWA